MDYPYISVIVPAYNAEKYIRRCLDSLRQQSLHNIEVIIVNDGSTDNTPSIIDEYAKQDERFKTFHTSNHGVAFARQFALERTSGEYVIHADADDWVDINMMESIYNKAKTENSDLVMCDVVNYYNNRIEIQHFNPPSLKQEEFFKNLLLVKYSSGLCHKLIRKCLFKDYNIAFDSSMTTSEDFYVLCQLFTHPLKIAYMPNIYYHYDKIANPNSITKKKIPMSHIISQMKCIDYLEKHYDTDKYKEGIDCRKLIVKQLMWDGGFRKKDILVDTYPEVNTFFPKGKKDRFGQYHYTYYIYNGHYYWGMCIFFFKKYKRQIKHFFKNL